MSSAWIMWIILKRNVMSVGLMQRRAGIGLLNKELDNSILPDLPGNTNSDDVS